MFWNKVSIETTEDAADIVSSALIDTGAGGVEIEGGSVALQKHDEHCALLPSLQSVSVSAYYGEHGFDKALQSIKDSLDIIRKTSETDAGTLKVSVARIPDTDWNENFKKHFTTFKAAGNIIVKPSWEDYSAKRGEVVIEIDPGMAFGSGVHETTKMCLELIQKHINKGDRVLDVGCGSGILGIAAAKLGAGSVLALDYDSVSVNVALDNARANGAGEFEARQSDLVANADSVQYDLIAANIIADIIIRLNRDVKTYMNHGAVYVISGIIADRLTDVLESLKENGLDVIETMAMGDWRAAAVRIDPRIKERA